MFTLIDGRPTDRRLLALEVDRLLRLTGDLQALRDGNGPAPSDLDDAPLLDNWQRAVRPASCLVGNAWDHPTLPGIGRPIVTSDLWVLAPDQGWARTLSRYYRLGRPRECSPSS